MKVEPEFLKLLPLLKKKLIYGKVEHFAFQTHTKWGADQGFGYDWKKRLLLNQDLENHFYRDYMDQGNKLIGGLALRSVFGANNDIVKKIVIDCDDKDLKEFVYKQVAPKCDKLGIEWMLEHGGEPVDHPLFSWDRCHFIMLTEVHKDLSTAFMRQFMGELGEPIFAKDVKFLGNPFRFDEVKGTGNQLMQATRFVYAYHLKRMKRFPMEFQGEVLDDPISVAQALINLKPITEDFMKSYIKEDFFPTEEGNAKKIYEGWTPEKLIYNSLNLPIPHEDDMPQTLRPLFRECQALNSMLNDAYEDDLIQEKGQHHHDSGLIIAGSARFFDVHFNQVQGKEWFWEKLVPNTRFRDAKSHHWWHGKDEAPGYQYLWNCKTIEEYADRCEGCKYQNTVTNPREFLFNRPISRIARATDKKLVTLDHIRNKTFPAFKQLIRQKHLNQERCNYLLASVTSAGKTTCVRELSEDLIKEFNTNILIAVHSAQVALEYRKWFKERGIEAFVHLSHLATFGHQADPPKDASLADYDCVFFKEIQEQARAGVQSQSYKEEFCYNGCPLLEQCHYPNQFSQVQEDEFKVVIIQHAHMSCTEVIHNLLKKGFGLLIVDETFIENTYDYVELDDQEIELLGAHGEDWTSSLSDWLSGKKKAKGKLNPSKQDLENIYDTFRGWEKPYRVPDLVRFYNQHRWVNPMTGIEIIYELPNVPIRIFTDATPPIDLIKLLTGIKNLQVFGANEIVDIKSIHPLNKRYQIIDMNNSVTKMKDEEFFELILTKTCELIRNKHKGEKCLITCYKNDRPRIKKFIEERYPDIQSRVDLGLIAKGTNKWVGFTVQFILAGRYRIGEHYYQDLYKYRAVANHYKVKNQEGLIPNIYQKDMKGIEIGRVPTKVKILQETNDRLREFVYNENEYYISGQYDDWGHIKPISVNPRNPYFWFHQMDLLDVADMIQAERVRPGADPITVYHCHNKHMDKLVITDPITTLEFLAL